VEVKDDAGQHLISVVADPDQLSLAIGKRGQNVRLTAKLVGWKIDIHKDESAVSFEEKVAQAIKELAAIPGITPDMAQHLVGAGFLSVEGILAAEPRDISEMLDIEIAEARAVYEAIVATQPDIQA
jgi:N utilization substance protein A